MNAGDGTHAHPTQALLDALTLREALGTLEGSRIAIVGDIGHSRVARSNMHCLLTHGRSVRVAGPPAWVAGFEEWPGVEVAATLAEALDGADAVMALRVQLERGAGGVPAWRVHADVGARRGAHAPRRPGRADRCTRARPTRAWSSPPTWPNGPRSLIGRQVENGVPVRMAVLALVAGAA